MELLFLICEEVGNEDEVVGKIVLVCASPDIVVLALTSTGTTTTSVTPSSSVVVCVIVLANVVPSSLSDSVTVTISCSSDVADFVGLAGRRVGIGAIVDVDVAVASDSALLIIEAGMRRPIVAQ